MTEGEGISEFEILIIEPLCQYDLRDTTRNIRYRSRTLGVRRTMKLNAVDRISKRGFWC